MEVDTFRMTTSIAFKKIITVATIVLFAIPSTMTTANSAVKSKNLSASNLVTISYPTLVSLPKAGCGKVAVKYKLNKLPIDESAFFVVIEDDQYRTIGIGEWYGTNYEGSVKAMPKSGILNIKVCRDMWMDADQEIDFYPAYRGNYTIALSAVGDMSADAKGSFKIS
ncbi:hypothetical protein MCEMRE203_00443 [Candidatus Nanopelagicaceae bacterium]